MDIIIGTLEQGIIYGILALGVYITYKILDFPDLTVDGSFPLGAAVTAVMLVNGANPYIAILVSMMAGAVSGLITGLIHVKLKVRDLLSGIITMTALYSINLHIAGSANVPLFGIDTIFSIESLGEYSVIIVSTLLIIVCKILLDLYLKTRSGYLLRAVGDNPTVVTLLAKDSGTVKIIGLAIANSLVALAGSVMCQQQRFFEISMGTGTIVIGLATVIIGTNLFKRVTFMRATTAVIIGSVLYKACVSIAISCGLEAVDLKLVTSLLFLIILIIGNAKFRGKKSE